ncbi:hypothetical protein BFP72_11205 [Reichenbachiella sp. 5M10]|uniref:sodium:solute symporter family protein n=1 Tax=Reichenbachiella sp. 5M10 TaxID=1889772 RepID=UPI000C15120D|nr:hypothetical protein [Reichenbachiella sp. 5M10]PIB35919.1 hypothetical protein BFP72_11205 [Reichenbachiella sp. 5M10]
MYVYLLVYILLIIGFSLYLSRSSSAEDFLIGGRNRGGLTILFSKFAGAVGVSTLISYTGYAYRFGVGMSGMLVGAVIGYALFAFWAAPRVKRLSLEGQFYTQGDLPAHLTQDKRSARLTNGVTTVVQFFWIVLSLAGGAKIIAYFDLFSYETALLLTTGVVMVYVLVSGFKAVVMTDVVQAVIILAFLGLLVYGMTRGESVDALLRIPTGEHVTLGSIIGLVLYGGLSVFGLADRYQLCYAARDEQSLKRGMGLAIVPVLIIAFLLLLLGLQVYRLDTSLDPDMVFVYATQNLMDTSWLPALLVLFFAGLMSTADSAIFAVASHVTGGVSSDKRVNSVRYATVITVVLAFGIAWFWRSIVDITIVGAALRMTLAVAMIYVIGGHQNKGRFMGSAMGGVLGLLIGLAIFGAKPTIAIVVLVGSLLGLLYRSKKVEVREV